MAQDLLARIHRLSRSLAARLGPVRPLARGAFRTLLRLRYGGETLMRAEQNGRVWLLSPEVALRGEIQEFETIEWFRSEVKSGMTVIDVGANVGQMTLELAALVGSGGRVISVEPAPGNVALLRKHVEANGFSDRVEVVEAASSDVEGTVRLFIGGEDAEAVGSGHTLAGVEALKKQDAAQPVHERQVRAVTIDGLCRSRALRPNVVKIDVEGAELKVLRGMAETLRTARPLVRVGFHPFAFEDPRRASDELRGLLADARYELVAPASGALELEEYVARPLP